MADCSTDSARELACRDGDAAAHIKVISIFVLFLASATGVSLPVMLAKVFQGKPVYDKAILVIKCFAAGVILSTSLVHVLPDAFAALADCQVASRHPWKDFPFAGLVTLVGALLALLVDLTASSHVDLHHYQPSAYTSIDESHEHNHHKELGLGSGEDSKGQLKVYTIVDEEEQGRKLVSPGARLEDGLSVVESGGGDLHKVMEAEDMLKLKQKLVSQVLEIGIIFHSVIIGVTMGMSQDKCTIQPLVAALSFHQIFEGMGLGGCIAQAGFGAGTVAHMCLMFSVTTPGGIIMGMFIFAMTGYDDNSPNALIAEGLLGSVSSGILIYMALVDLIAADFFHNKMMNCEVWMKRACFVALVLGSSAMSILALWA